jgi:Na+-driven multidrug efflux pump
MAPGIIALSCNSILTHYFSGIGKHKIAMQASLVALGSMIVLNLVLIPIWGINGAAIAVSAAFLVQFVFGVMVFLKEDELHWKDFLISKADLDILKSVIRSIRKS